MSTDVYACVKNEIFSIPEGYIIVNDYSNDMDEETTVAVPRVQADYTIADGDTVVLADANGSARTITLPTAVGRMGTSFTVVKIDSGNSYAITIAPQSGETIDGAASWNLQFQYNAITLTSDGVDWYASASIGLYQLTALLGDTYLRGMLVFDANSTEQAITAVGNTITCTKSVNKLNPDGNYTLSSTPSISAGVEGQILILYLGGAEANTITLTDEAGLPGSTLQLGAGTRVLTATAHIQLFWNGTYWVEIGFTG